MESLAPILLRDVPLSLLITKPLSSLSTPALTLFFVWVISFVISSNLIERNEAAAVQTLLQIAEAQRTLRASAAIDTDSDAIGEYGFFGELVGVEPLRVDNGMNSPGCGVAPQDLLNPPLLPSLFANLEFMPSFEFGIVRNGYAFQIFLPNASVTVDGVGQRPCGGSYFDRPGSNHAEQYWCAYAFPVEVGISGQRAFCINQSGDIVATSQPLAAQRYTIDGVGFGSPRANAAYTGSSMSTTLAMGSRGFDMNLWQKVR